MKHPDQYQIDATFYHHRIIRDIEQLYLFEANCSLLWLNGRKLNICSTFREPLMGHLILDTFMSITWEIMFLPKDRRHHDPGPQFTIDTRNWWKWKISDSWTHEVFYERVAFLGSNEKEENEANLLMSKIAQSFSFSPKHKSSYNHSFDESTFVETSVSSSPRSPSSI